MFHLFLLTTVLAQLDCIPYGERISLGLYYSYLEDQGDYITIAFNTKNVCSGLVVTLRDDNHLFNIPVEESNLLNMTKVYEGTTTEMNYETYIHKVKVGKDSGIMEGQSFTYAITYEEQTVGPFSFQVPYKQLGNENKETKIMVFGDMDSNWSLNISKSTFDWLQKQVENDVKYDSIIYLGDMAYDLETNNCQFGDDWVRNISLFTSKYPFMVTAGNHDEGQNNQFTYFENTFMGPKITISSEDFYSFQLGLLYVIQFNPYIIEYNSPREEYIDTILNQMEQELIRVPITTNWLVIINHYPMYCSNMDDKFCQKNFEIMQKFEDLYIKYKVDISFAGHQHSYERDEPLYKNQTASYKSLDNGHIYKNAQAPLHIVEGAGGNAEIEYQPEEIFPNQFFTKAQAVGNGVGIMTIKNSTHLYYEHIMMKDNSQSDYFWIVKEQDDSTNIWIYIYIALGVLLALILILIAYLCCKSKKTQKLDLIEEAY